MSKYWVKLAVEMIREEIEHDLQVFESDERSEDGKYLFLLYYRDVGVVAPFDWLKPRLAEYQDKWEKFMEGQTFCMAGFYIRDVCRFLDIIEREADRDRKPR